MSFNVGYKGKTTAGTGAFYAPYLPKSLTLNEIWERKFAWLPVRCKLSNKILWLTFAYRQYLKWREDMDFRCAATGNWHHEQEHTVYLLKE